MNTKTLERLNELNKDLHIFYIKDSRFDTYGRVLSNFDVTSILDYASKSLVIPDKGNVYVPTDENLELFEVVKQIELEVYGAMPVEAGYCAGHNKALTGVEYHQGSEVVIASTDCIVILGKQQDIKNNMYNSSIAEAFFVPAGSVIELYSTTLHYSPCKTEEGGFRTIVILPNGTNLPLKEKSQNILLTKTNKFLMVHESQKEKIASGVHPGLIGDLIEVKY